MKAWQAAVVLVAIHAILAAGYALLTPYRTPGRVLLQGNAPALDVGAPDERQHANYIQRLVEGRGLPVFDPHDPNLYESYQSHQPPLYYVLAAGWARMLGVQNVEAPDAGLRLRLLNVLLGAVGVWGLFLAGRWLNGDDNTGLMAAAAGGLLPMGCALSGAVSNDPLLITLCTYSLAFQVRATTQRSGRHDLWWAALLAGLAMLTKTSGVALLPGLALAGWWRWRLQKERRAWAGAAGPVFLALAIVLPWWIRNNLLYGDPLAARAFQQAFTGSMQASQGIERVGLSGYWLEVGKGTWCSFVGVFGYWDIWLESGIYWAVAAATGVALAAAFARLRFERPAGLLVSAVFATCVLALFVRFNMQYFQAQGRYVYPAIGAFSVWVAFGIQSWFRKLWPALATTLCLLVLNVHSLQTLPPEFRIRTQATETSELRLHRT